MNDASKSPAIERVFNIVEYIAKNDVGYSYNEISRVLNLPLNSVYRFCVELEKKNYLVKENNLLYIGPAFYIIGKVAEKRIDILNVAKPIMRELNEMSNETVHLDILNYDINGNNAFDMTLLHQVETSQSIKMSVSTGMIGYLHASGFGKCLLAYNNYKDYPAEKLVGLTPNTIVTQEALEKECEKVKSNGYAIDNEEYVEGLYCIGAPIFNSKNECFAAIGIQYLKYRYDDAKRDEAIKAVTEAARKISYILKNSGV